jgi:hypothetical protein
MLGQFDVVGVEHAAVEKSRRMGRDRQDRREERVFVRRTQQFVVGRDVAQHALRVVATVDRQEDLHEDSESDG